MRLITSIGFAASLTCVASSAWAAVTISNPWIREAPPTSSTLAAYVEFSNNGKKAETLTGASSPAFEAVEFHTVQVDKGMMRMLPLRRVVLAPGESVVFEPGSQHLMLKKPKHSLVVGEKVPIQILFDNGTHQEILFEVRK